MSESRPRQVLQANVESFYRAFESRHGDSMECTRGCARCCYATLTVFPDEAWEIVLWFRSLGSEERSMLREGWRTQETTPRADAAGRKQVPCAFLVNERCTAYPARPVICRTQGLPLQFREENKKEKTTLLHIDVCPLNFRAEGSMPPREEALDLDRVNALQSIAARAFETPAELVALLDGEGRIPLQHLREFLMGERE